ncbi:MAG TPA: hypothetical protein VGT24_10150 [Candidatus Acidoferrales bacterium]|nr:hypothetical protein [Candidatus Acidoferrales bacterium]
MRRILEYSFLACVFFGLAANTRAQSIVPAGTLLQCTLNEPNFSSATASVGDPVVCYLKTVQQFGHILLPRGSYLEGHLAAAKEPGHFWGKGYLRLEFDRIGLPNTDIPVPSKVIAASGGFRSDRQGDIVGKGHAKRDVAEWMLPPLWPWKMLMLPARGPRPTLKGEELLTLRLMDDVVVPKLADIRPSPAAGWHYFDEPAQDRPQAYAAPQGQFALASLSITADTPAAVQPGRVTLIALKTNDVFGVTSYRIDNGRLNYVLSSGTRGSAEVAEVDWTKTSQLNAARATEGTLESRVN